MHIMLIPKLKLKNNKVIPSEDIVTIMAGCMSTCRNQMNQL
jgi:hypothetical protein